MRPVAEGTNQNENQKLKLQSGDGGSGCAGCRACGRARAKGGRERTAGDGRAGLLQALACGHDGDGGREHAVAHDHAHAQHDKHPDDVLRVVVLRIPKQRAKYGSNGVQRRGFVIRYHGLLQCLRCRSPQPLTAAQSLVTASSACGCIECMPTAAMGTQI